MSAFTLHAHAMRDCTRLLRRRAGAFALAVLLCASALALPLLAATVGLALAPLAGRLPTAPEVSVFASLSFTQQDILALKGKLERLPNVERVQWIPRDRALAELMRRTGGSAPLAELKPNPLPDTLVMSFSHGISPDALESVATDLRKLPGVDGVHADSSWFRKAVGLTRVLTRAALFVGGVTLLLLMLAVIGAIRLIAITSRDELRLLRLIGADVRQMARPYAYAGAITLLFGSALAAAAVGLLLTALAQDLDWLAQVLGTPVSVGMLPWPALAAIAATALAAGAIGGSIGLRSALRRIA